MRWLVIALAITLIALLVASTLPDAKLGAVVLVGPIPVVFASDVAMVLPLLIFTAILIAILILFSHLITREISEERVLQRLEVQKPEKKFGGVVLIGPLPIIFGDARVAIFASLVAVVLMVLALLLMLGGLR